MNLGNRNRGLLPASAIFNAVHNVGGNEADFFAELAHSIKAFKDDHAGQVAALRREIDQLNATTAAMQIGGGAGRMSDMGPANGAMVEFLRTGNPEAMQAFIPRNEMSTDYGPGGGYAVPKEIDRVIQSQMIATSPIRAVASVVTVNTSDYSKLINRRGATSGWVGERDPRTETETPLLAEISPPMGELYAYPSITQWALDDSAFNLADFVQENVADKFAYDEGVAFVTGTGVKRPMGLLSVPFAATDDSTRPMGTFQYVVSGNASDFATTSPADALLDLIYTLRAPYRVGPKVGWMMNSKTAGRVRKFKDADGNYLWQNALQQGEPALLCGYPVWINDDFPDVAANAYPIAFGNWEKGYIVVDRIGTRFIRDPFTKPGWVKFYVSKRVGGAPTDTNAIKFLKISV